MQCLLMHQVKELGVQVQAIAAHTTSKTAKVSSTQPATPVKTARQFVSGDINDDSSDSDGSSTESSYFDLSDGDIDPKAPPSSVEELSD